MLGRLRITQRLGLLLVLPLLAVLLTSVPLAVERVADARSAAAIVDSAHNARTVAAVIADLQAERLLALAYLASSRVSHAALVTQIQTVRDLAAQAGPRLGSAAPPALLQALTRLVNLDDVRQAVLDRQATMTATQDAYHRAVVSLLDALRLPDQPLADAAGLRQMASLDAMLRAGEIANQVDAALVMGAVDPAAAGNLVAVSGPLEQVHLDRFRQQGDPAHVALLDLTAQGPSANRVRELAAAMTRPDGTAAPVSLDTGLAAAQAGIAIRTGVTDHVVNDIATRASGRATSATTAAALVGGSVLGLIALVVWLGTVVSRSVSRPLRRVTAAATAVANLAARELVRVTDVESDDHRPPRLTAVRVRSADELGELASAFNRVQATAALMMEQQVTTRRNVAVMFANIARRTGGLVARQLSQIEELERDEPDQRRLARLYRLDHLTARLRRSADSLLVVAGVRPDARIDAPMPLADVIRSAIGEVEGYRRVELGTVSNSVVTAAVVPDLILLLAELLENATAFSPPGTYVDISADVGGNGIVQIIDRGIGMLPQRLAEENLRLVTRERLDIAPTARLGLLVVGRLARRHGLRVRLQATVPTGVTVEVALPQNVFLRTLAHAITPEPAPAPDRPSPGTTVAQRTTSSPATTGSPYTTPLPGTAPLPGTIDSPGSTPSRDTAPLHGTVISQGPAVSRGRVRAQGAAAALNAALSQGAASLRDPALPPGAPVSQGPPLLHGAAPSRDASASLDASSSPGAASSRDAAATQSAASSRADAHARAIGGTSAGTTPSSSTDPLQADTASLVADALARTRGRRPGAPPQPHDPSRPDARAQPDAPSRTDAPARPHAPSQPNRRPATEGPSRGDRPSPTMGRPPADPLTRPDTHSRAEGASGNDGLPSAGSLSPIDPLTRSDASPGEDLRHPRTDRPSRSDGLSLMDSSVPADAPAAVDARTLASDASPTHASTPAGANGGQIAPLSRAGLRRRQPGQSLADLEVPQPNPGPAARDPAAERELFDSFVRGTARAAEEAATGQATAEESRGGLRQRRRGEHLDESLRGEPPRARGPWLSSSGPRQPPPVGPPSPTQPASPTPTIATVPPVPATEGAWPGSTASRPWAERPAAERAPRRPRVGPAGPAAGTGQPGPSSPVPGIGVAPGPGQRDAEAERSIYGGYLAGLARAKQASQAESDGYPHSDEQRSTS